MAKKLIGKVIMSNDEYHSSAGISKSALDTVAKSPRHYWARYVDPSRKPEQPTAAMAFGTAVHMAVLEPEAFAKTYVAEPVGIDRRTKEGKAAAAEFEAANAGRIVLKADDFARCQAVAAAVRAHPLAGAFLANGEAEASFFAKDPETGALVKCRPDWISANGKVVVDLKTTEDASPAGFGRSAGSFRYHVQAAWYTDVLDLANKIRPEHFVFLAVEKSPPYAVGVYYCDEATLAAGRELARRDLAALLECQRLESWPDYGTDAMPLQVPAWALK